MLLANRLPRILLAFIYAIAIAAGVGNEHNIAGSMAVCVVHIVFRILPDSCFCLNDKPYFSKKLEEDVYDSIALVFAVVGCTFAVAQNAVTDSGVAVSLFASLAVTFSFAIGKSKKPKNEEKHYHLHNLLDDEEEEDNKGENE